MKKKILYQILITIIILLNINNYLLSYEKCDSLRNCSLRALTLTVNSGKGAHYLDILKNNSQNNIKSAFSFEAWIKCERQSSSTQFIGGLWGPSVDKNDSWVIFIDDKDSLTFELDGGLNLKQLDNTILKIPFSQYYSKWTHLAAIFDGTNQTIYFYINGYPVDSARNNIYPITQIKKIQNNNLGIQIGSINGLSDSKSFRTFRGQIEELRIWTKVLSPKEILCNKDLSLEGNEKDLLVYYRFNEVPNNYYICDATANRNNGIARSGASCQPSDRQIKQNLTAFPLSINDTLKCETSKTFTFTIMDTSICGQKVWMRVIDDLASSYTISPNIVDLVPNTPVNITVTLKTNYVGNISSRFQIIPYNRCGIAITIPIKLTRMTELSYSKNVVDFGTILTKCDNIPYVDSIIKVCNITDRISGPRDITINSILTQKSKEFIVLNSGLPKTLKPGECFDVIVRFFPNDTSFTHNDTLKIFSDDKCLGSGIIPLKATSLEVIKITDRGGSKRLDTLDFRTICVNLASDGIEYLWSNPTNQDVIVDSIRVPKHFLSKSLKFPIVLKPKTGYNPNYFRFLPTAQGVFKDSIIFYIRTNGCVVAKKIYVLGRGFLADLKFELDSLDFGTVIVGNEKTLNLKVTNLSTDTLRVSFYLKRASVFSLPGTKSVTLRQNQSASFPILFKPYEDSLYYDEVCLFEQRCFTSQCIRIKGIGLYERFRYSPALMKTENVIACQSRLDSLIIKNISKSEQTLNEFILNPNDRFSLYNPPSFPSNISLQPEEEYKLIFNYVPNDITKDRSDLAFLSYKTQDNIEWKVELLGSSLLPKLYVDDLKIFGALEVGDSKIDTVTIENSSPVDMILDSITTTNGYTIIYPSIVKNVKLKPRDTINVLVKFAPLDAIQYDGKINVYASSPCSIKGSGELQGKGIIVKMEVPNKIVSYGFVKPCECKEREVVLINQSLVFDMQVDTVWFDTTGIKNGNINYFSWRSHYSPKGSLPYKIPPMSFDTMYIKFCPRNISRTNLVDVASRLNIRGSGSGWKDQFETFVIGKMMLFSVSNPDSLLFPPTRVDTFSVSKYSVNSIPSLNFSPDQEPVKIDSITFLPDERVFYASDSLKRAFPIIVAPNQKFTIKADFKPRAVRSYQARMVLHISEPCEYKDTTIYVSGSSFAPAFGLDIGFSSKNNKLDTFRFLTCDTIKLPIYSTRDIPAKWYDIKTRIGYDTNKLDFIGASSEYLNKVCNPYKPRISWQKSPFGAYEVNINSFCDHDSTKPLFYVYLKSKTGKRDTLNITVDSIKFDTPDVILYHIIAESGFSKLVILEPELKLLNNINFDSVRVLDCKTDTIYVKNIGDVPLKVSDLAKLHKDYKLVSMLPSNQDLLNIGDTAKLIVKFCPNRKETLDSNSLVVTEFPCDLIYNVNLKGIGYAPEFPLTFDLSTNFTIPDTVSAQIGDTIVLPILLDRDIALVLDGKLRWLEQVKFKLNLKYNPYALKYIDYSSNLTSSLQFDNGNLKFAFNNIDSLKSGEILKIKFLVTIPDSIETMINISSYDFDSDSILFLDIKPFDNGGIFRTGEKCNLRTMKIDNAKFFISQNYPNPWKDFTNIEFLVPEDANYKIGLYASDGKFIKNILSEQKLKKGLYLITIYSKDLVNGNYFYIIESENLKEVKQMILNK